jgi:hypothetical protein
MDYPLPQAGEKLVIIHGKPAAAGLAPGSGVKKNHVQIRPVTEFNPAQLSISNDGKTRVDIHTVHLTYGCTVLFNQVFPGQPDDFIEHRFGDVGKIIAGSHQR